MNKKLRYQTVDFSIANGTDYIAPRKRIYDGNVIAAAVHVDGDLPNEIINLGIKSTGGTPLIDETNLKDWQQRNGGCYLTSMKPLNLDGGVELIFEFSALTALDKDLKGQIVLVIEQPCNA